MRRNCMILMIANRSICTCSFLFYLITNRVMLQNCHRGSALGALVGSIRGMEAVPPLLVSGLVAENELREEIDEFVNKATAKMSANVKL